MSELATTLKILRRGLPVLISCVVLAGAAAYAYSRTRTKLYTASASLWFRDPGFDQKLFGSNYLAPATDPTTQENTDVDLSSLPAVAQRTAQALGGRRTVSEVKAELKAVPQGQSDIVDLVATDRDPAIAAAIATNAGQQFVAFRRTSDRATIQSALRNVRFDLTAAVNSGPQQAQLRQLEDELQVLSSLQTGNVQLIQAASVPTAASSPQVARDTAAGIVLGLLIGLAAVFARDRLDQRIKDREDLHEVTDLPILAEVPEQRSAMGPNREVVVGRAQLEAFGLLRASLRYLDVGHDLKSILVTSASPGEGKTTVASGLALAAASAGVNVLLIEADLRKPTLTERLSLEHRPGLSEFLTHQVDLADAIQRASVMVEGSRTPVSFDILASGATPPNPSMLLESEAVPALLATVRHQYDLVVLDTAPVALVSDGIPVLKVVDGVLVVCALNQSRRDIQTRLLEQLRQIHAPVLGVVANRSALSSRPYDDYYAPAPEGAGVTA